jgi:hypothetical protein
MMHVTSLRRLIREILVEGGLKIAAANRADLNSQTVREASSIYVDFLKGWNAWLKSKNKQPVEPIGPSGSSVYADVDAEEGKDVIYGDVDYLVSFPAVEEEDFGTRRKAQAQIEREYTDLLREYINSVRPKEVDVDATLKPGSTPLQVILRMSGDRLVQVDTVVTFPEHSQWMRGRYTPERGIKGYVTGNLYKALGDYLKLTIGTEGVVARLKDGQRVTSKQRAGVTYKKVSGDFDNFFVDIAKYLAGDDVELSDSLKNQRGMDSGSISVVALANGIVGLADTLSTAGIVDRRDMLTVVLDSFKKEMDDTLTRKADRDLDPAKQEQLRKMNEEQATRVAEIFGI